MVNRLQQTTFASAPFTSSRINLHQHVVARSNDLIIFVHGLNGQGYKTWRNFPAFLFDEFNYDVAMFDYRTLFRRIGGGGAPFNFYVEQFEECIRELAPEYSSIFLVGHSLGGILIEAAVKQYLIHQAMVGNNEEVRAVAGIILMASPIAGSAWAIPVLRNLLSEGRVLRRASEQSAATTEFFSTYVQNQNTAFVEPGKTLLPCYSCIVGNDWFVNKFSAGFNIPRFQRKKLISGRLHKGHSSIAKPAAANDEQVRWIRRTISEMNEVRQQRGRLIHHAERRPQPTVNPPLPVVVTKFWASPNGTQWVEIYNDVRRSAATPDLEVHDYRDAPGFTIDLLMTASDAEAIVDNKSNERSIVAQAREERRDNERLTVGISPVGQKCLEAKKQVEDWMQTIGWLPSIYVEEAADEDALRRVMARWVQTVVNRDPRRGLSHPALIEKTIRNEGDPLDPRTGGRF